MVDSVRAAHAPAYTDSGRQMGDWVVRINYDSVRDDLIVSWNRSATPHLKGTNGHRLFAGDDIEQALAEAEYRGRVLGVRRLF